MKKILVVLFALISAQAFGQAYSSTVLQNSAGNYGRPVPYPQVLVCVSSDTNVPCISRATTYSDDTLNTQCSQTGSSGLLIGNPTSGPNCNNPGIGDVNGNFTIYVAGGEYMICTYSGTWLCQKQTVGGGNSGSGIVNSCIGGANCNAYYPLPNVPSIVGDPLVTDDGAGNEAGKTFTTTQTGIAGFHYFTQGSAPILSVNNSVYFYAPVSVSTYAWVLPGTAGSGCMQASNSSGLVTISFTGVNCGSGAGATFQVNGINTTSQTTINFQNSSSITFSNPSAGNITATASLTSSLLSPSAPTLANNNAAGARSITYLIVGCQDGPTCAYHSAATATQNIANANASPQVQLSAYADTLYGYRCYAIYVTSDSGVRTTGKIEGCAWKNFIDTGGNGDGSTAPATNTTQVWATPLPLPGCNIAQGQVTGIDAPPCSPTADDDEFTWGDGTIEPGDANDPFWSWLNQNSATATLTNGMVELQAPSRSGLDNLNCMERTTTLPSTPYSYVITFYPNWSTGTSSHNNITGFGFYESATGKIQLLGNQSLGSTNNRWIVSSWNNTFTTLTATQLSDEEYWPYQIPYIGVTNDGTHITYYTSPDGIHYQQTYQSTITNFFTTAPNHLVVCIDAHTGTYSMDIDYIRKVTTIP